MTLESLNFLNGDISIIKILSILYLFIFANVLSQKINEKIAYKLNENILLKHIIGLITIGIILSLIYDLSQKDLIFYSILIYFIFLLSTKISSQLIGVVIIILSGVYFYDYFMDSKINQVKNDNLIDINKKNSIITDKKNKKRNITLFMILVVVAGSLLYENEKVNQLGGSFSFNKFINL